MTNKPKATEYFSEIRPLSKGGKLAVEVMPGMESFTLGFFFPVGAANESAGISGVSHFIEHMVFKGSKRRTPKQIVQAIERVGGLINASTGREATYYHVRIGSSRLDLALDVLTDLVFNPAFDPVAMEREKGVVLEEMKMNEDDPEQALFDRFLQAIHGKTAFGRTILGNETTIKSLTPDTVWDYHRSHYSPSRLVASIAGGIDPDEVHALLEKKLKRFRRDSPAKIPSPKPPRFKAKILAHSKDIEQAEMIVGFPSVNVVSPQRYAYSLLDAISAGGMMSRLFQEIREKRGLVYSIDSAQQPYTSGGIFTVDAGAQEQNLLKVLRLILKEFVNLAGEGPRKKELVDAKLYLRGHWALGLESTSVRMIRNAMSTVFFNRLIPHDEVVNDLEAVTQDEVAEAAARIFDNGGPAVAVLSKFDDGKATGEMEDKIRATVEQSRQNGGVR